MLAAADCTGIEEYIEARRELRDAYRTSFLEQLAGVPPNWEVNQDTWIDTLLSLSDDQLTTLSQLYADWAAGLREIEPPAVAVAYHNQTVLAYQRLSNLYRDAATMGLIAASLLYGPAEEATPVGQLSLNDQLSADCPAWAVYDAESSATPTS